MLLGVLGEPRRSYRGSGVTAAVLGVRGGLRGLQPVHRLQVESYRQDGRHFAKLESQRVVVSRAASSLTVNIVISVLPTSRSRGQAWSSSLPKRPTVWPTRPGPCQDAVRVPRTCG